MLPLIIRNTDEMLRLVPNELREGSFALGSRRVRTIRTVVLPHAVPGHRERLPARHRACGGRDGAAALHDRDRERTELEPLQGHEHALCRCRSSATPRRRSSARRSAPMARR